MTTEQQTDQAAGAQPAADLPAGQAQPPAERPRNPVPASALPESALLAKKAKWQREAQESERAKLLADLGIEDVDSWKADQQKRREADEQRQREAQESERAKLGDVDRLKAQLADKDREIEQLRAELAKARAEHASAGVQLLVRDAAAELIDPAMREDAEEALKRHIRKLGPRDQKRFDADDASEFFKALVKEKPGYAKRQPAPRPAAPPARRAVTNGAPPNRTAPPAGGKAAPAAPNGGKTAAPGKENSMSDDEVRQSFKRLGIDYKGGRGAPTAVRPNGAAR